MHYVKFEAVVPNALGVHPEIFAVANGLARDGRLTKEDRIWWRVAHDLGNRTYSDPSSSDRTVFDRKVNPGAQSWFKGDSIALIKYARAYVKLVKRYGLDVAERRSDDPGKIVYEDSVQVVGVPRMDTLARLNKIR